MDRDELIDNLYETLIDPEPEDPRLKEALREMMKKMVEDGSLEEMIK